MILYVALMILPYMAAAIAIISYGLWCNKQMEKKYGKK